jgi:CRISPR-associated protein Cas2
LTAVQFVKLQLQVEKLIKPVEDSVRIYVLGAGSVKPTITYGSQPPREERAIVF